MNNILKLRINAELANTHSEDTFPTTNTMRIVKKKSKSPLRKCNGRGACGVTSCVLKAYHLGPCVWNGG